MPDDHNDSISRALEAEAAKRGAIDPSAGLLADRTNIKVGHGGTVYGADLAVIALRDHKPHLFPVPDPKTLTSQQNEQRIEQWQADERRKASATDNGRATEVFEKTKERFEQAPAKPPTANEVIDTWLRQYR